jgi:hypothetical protein
VVRYFFIPNEPQKTWSKSPMAKPSKIKAIAAQRGVTVRDLLISECSAHGSQRAAAISLGVSASVICNHLKFEGLKLATVIRVQEKAS